MPLRPTETDPEREQAITDARAGLHDALVNLAGEAALAAKVYKSKRGQSDLASVHGAASAVRRAEETLDLAVLDRDTAAGADA